jgi:hypothetical protein
MSGKAPVVCHRAVASRGYPKAARLVEHSRCARRQLGQYPPVHRRQLGNVAMGERGRKDPSVEGARMFAGIQGERVGVGFRRCSVWACCTAQIMSPFVDRSPSRSRGRRWGPPMAGNFMTSGPRGCDRGGGAAVVGGLPSPHCCSARRPSERTTIICAQLFGTAGYGAGRIRTPFGP